MATWAKHKKENREYGVSIKHEAEGYVYICEEPLKIREMKLRYGFIDCEAPIIQKAVQSKPAPQPITPAPATEEAEKKSESDQ